jgi:hypothetical protein
MNTVKKFLDATGYKRGTNHPEKEVLKAKMDELGVTEEAKIDIMSFFLYDDGPDYMCVNCGGGFDHITFCEDRDADFCDSCY